MKKIFSIITLLLMMFTFSTVFAAENITESNGFYVKKIDDEIFARIKGKSYKDDCTVPREDLRYLHVLHKDLDGQNSRR